MSLTQVPSEAGQQLQNVERLFLRLRSPNSDLSLLRRYLTEQVFEAIKDCKTPFGGGILEVIRSGVENAESEIGVYATDAASYSVFAPLFQPIIMDYHCLRPGFSQPQPSFGSAESLLNLNQQKDYVISTRIRCGRSFKGYPFNSLLNENEYVQIEEKMKNVFKDFAGDIEGEYESLSDMTLQNKKQLIDEHLLFKEGDRFLEAANACRFWPRGRGMFCNKSRTLIVWVNEEDHLRIISMEKGANLPIIYSRFVKAVQLIQSKIEFARDEKLGYLTFCPSNIGTGIRASAHIKLPYLAKNASRLKQVTDNYCLQVRGTRGEHSDVEDAVFDISNKRRCGLTEFDVVKEFQAGILEVIREEEAEAMESRLQLRKESVGGVLG